MFFRGRAEFKFFDVFPVQSPLSSWLVALCLARDDLNDCSALFLRCMRDADPQRALYLFRMLSGHVREAVRLILGDSGRKPLESPDIRGLVDSTDGTSTCLDHIRRLAEPWIGSYVRSRLGPVRHLAFHYDEERMQNLLEDLHSREPACVASLEAGATMEATRYVFAQRVVTEGMMDLVLKGSSQLTELARAVSLLADILVSAHLKQNGVVQQ